ncbi:MAG: ABC-F family ATP-binding cassette domain-containing protein [Alphaproteobacteria bacterium]|nr:ABC-F family ATP-binding cassette domain-containing protein [Alphaproteobacteria bacterium]
MAEKTPIFALKNVHLSFGTHSLFQGLNIYVGKGDKICLIGRNGSGKSTLLKVIAGQMEPDIGERFVQPNTKIAYMPQEEDFSRYTTLKEVILSGLPDSHKDETYKADILIDALDISAMQNPHTASGGERKKTALARALIGEPDLLLLDEPTNHLDIATIEKLEKIIQEHTGAIIIISHDRRFLTKISNSTIWLDRGIAHLSDKGYASFEEWQEQIINQEIIEQKNLNKRIAEETEWLHKGVTARRKRNMGRLRRLQQLRLERKEQIKQTASVNLQIDKGLIQSKMITEAKKISKSFGDRTLIQDFSIRILRGNKIGIVGPNGAGKTTLIKLLTKRLEPDSGSVRIAKNLEEAYFDQNRISLDPNKTLWKTLCPEGDHIFVRGHFRHVVSYLKDFLFTSAQANTPVNALSGGEKNRLMLAVALAKPSNFLVLDEPTNDLDMDTLDLLQEVLDEYEGTVLIVSHDRDFLDKVATSLLYMSGNGTVIEHVGTYTQLLDNLKQAENKQKNTNRSEKMAKSQNTVAKQEKSCSNKNKLTFTEAHLLKELPTKIDKQTILVQQIQQKLEQPDIYTDTEKLLTTTRQLHQAQKALEELENTWLELQIKAEETN